MIPDPHPEDLAAGYLRALRAFLGNPSEENLAEGYELGRRALRQGHALIDWAALHETAVLTVARDLGNEPVFERAGTFFRESLTPF
jgi:Phosphoserine phosphatase RsbU, N-terminal domain